MQVILVAHNIGGACVSYAMECFPSKVSKAIFVAAAMIQDGQRAFDLFVRQVSLYDRFLMFNYSTIYIHKCEETYQLLAQFRIRNHVSPSKQHDSQDFLLLWALYVLCSLVNSYYV